MAAVSQETPIFNTFIEILANVAKAKYVSPKDWERLIVSWNVANAGPDDEKNPLTLRIPMICEVIKTINPDVIVLLEAGRPTKDIDWTTNAGAIQRETGLRYLGCMYSNPTLKTFGKAVFYNPETVDVATLSRERITNQQGFNADIVRFNVRPVFDQKIVIGMEPVNVAAVHVPPHFGFPERRIDAAKAIRSMPKLWYELFVGDFNTFPEDGGPEMIEEITKDVSPGTYSGSLVSCLPDDTTHTFKAFEHDISTVNTSVIEAIRKNPLNEILEEGPEKCSVRFSSWLDHVFATQRLWNRLAVVDCKVGPITGASDHAPTLTTIDFSRLI